ncbi:hypothetical protein LCGC14_0572990 [marine sediment metagenome]|uniref:VRR-NUC domain-containing protein n=1 Tax=marine sediment metagenome TaxID=412755 RepID=A0A0F9URY0_9ZZZZ
MTQFSRRPPAYAKRTDPNQAEIVDALRKAGAWVYVAHQPFDLLVAFRGELNLLEVKTDKGRLNKKQKCMIEEMRVRSGCCPLVVRSVDEALGAIGAAHE